MSAPPVIAGHPLEFGDDGALRAWAPWRDILARTMAWYRQCPTERGYPRFACETFLDAKWRASTSRDDIIPATQNGTGVLSYLAYRRFAGDAQGRLLDTARDLGRYLVRETLTPATGAWPQFTRSTGRRNHFPQAPDGGAQSDRPYEIQPDKGGIAGHALLALWQAEGSPEFLAQALRNARTLRTHQTAGDAAHSPWPFRVDWRDGASRGPVSGNMSYILRLYDALLALGYTEFTAPRAALWHWVWHWQVPSATGEGALFAQFFEDHDTPTNRSAWAPLSLARYLLEGGGALDPERRAAARILLDFTERTLHPSRSRRAGLPRAGRGSAGLERREQHLRRRAGALRPRDRFDRARPPGTRCAEFHALLHR